jgi:O-antigen/teichoic acid export membrane protein
LDVRKSLAWSFAQQATQFALGAVGSIIIARLLTPAEVGVFALALSASYLLSVLSGAGVDLYLIREPDLDASKIRSAFGVMIVASWLFGLVLLLLREPAARLYGEPGMAPVMALVSLAFFMAPFGQPALSLLNREMRFDVLYRIALLSTLVGTTTSVALAFLGFSYYALACGQLASTALTSLLALIHEPRHLRLRPSLKGWREVLRFGGLISAANLAGTAAAQGTKFVLGALQAPASVAIYERALSLSLMPGGALLGPLARVQTPAYAEAMRRGQPITSTILRVTGVTTVVIWPMFAVIGTLSVPIVVTIFGENWLTAGEILPFVLLAQALLAALPQSAVVLVPSGQVVWLLVLRLFYLFTVIPLAVIGSSVSLELFAQLLPLSAFVFVLAAYIPIRRVCGLSARALVPAYTGALVVATVSVVPAVVARLWYPGDVPLGGLAAVAATTPLVWFGALALLRHDLMTEIRALPFVPGMLGRALGHLLQRGKH